MALDWIGQIGESETEIVGDVLSIVERYKARTGPVDSFRVILDARPDFKKRAQHPRESTAYVKRFSPVVRAVTPQAQFWEITVEWSSEVDGETKDNPLDRPAEISIENQPRDKIRFRDAKKRPVVNTAGDLFDDPPPTESVNNLVFVVEKNIPTTFPDWILRYRNAVNTDAVRLKGRTLAAETLKIQKLTVGKDDTENGVDFCALRLEIEHDPDTWTQFIPNRGFNRLEYDKRDRDRFNKRRAAKKEILLADGSSPKDPQWLDIHGQWIEEPWNNLDKLVFLPFDFGELLPFNRLPLR